MPEGKKSYIEFAKAIKEKYPDYKDVDDHVLAAKMVEKYPEYADQVDLKQEDIKKKSANATLPSSSNPEVANTSVPSVMAGGTSGLATTHLVSSNQFDAPGRVNPTTLQPVGQQNAPANPYVPAPVSIPSKEDQDYEKQILSFEKENNFTLPTDQELKGAKITPPSTFSGGQTALGENLQEKNYSSTKQDKNGMFVNVLDLDADGEMKSFDNYMKKANAVVLKDVADFYDQKFVPSRNLKGLPVSDKSSTVDFYMEYLKEKNPEEYQYTQEKLKNLQETVDEDKKTGEDKEDTSEDQLALEKLQAEIQLKAFRLRTEAFKGKYEMANNKIKNYYQDKVDEFNTLDSGLQQDYNQLTAIQEQINKFPKNEQGQLITNAGNRKEAEALMGKQSELVASFKQKKDRQDELKQDQDFSDAVSIMSGVQKDYDEVSNHYYEMATNNPEAYKNLPEYKKLIEQKAIKKKVADYVDKNIATDFGIGPSVGRAVTNTITKLAYIPKSLTSNSEYGWTDKLYDVTKDNIDDFNDDFLATPSGLDKPLLEDGKWNLKYLPGKVAGTATDMAIMILLSKGAGAGASAVAAPVMSGEAASSFGSVVSGYVMSASGYYDEAKDAGMSDKEAVSFSRSLALQQGLLELISPNENIINPSKIKGDLSEFAAKVANGATRKEAIFETTKNIIKKTVPEVTQENLQLIDELANKYTSKELSGELDSARQTVGEQMIETSIITALTTLGIGGKSSLKTTSSLNKQALYMAASSPDKVMGSLENMLKTGQISEQKAADVMQKITIASEAIQKMDQNIPVEKQIDILPEMVNKLMKEQEEKSVDSNFKSAKKEEVASIDERIQNVLNGVPDVDDNDVLAGFEEDLLNEKAVKDEKAKETNEAKVLTTEADNKMQEDGLSEVDTSESRQPIDLSVETPAKEKESVPVVMEVSLPSQMKNGLARNMVFDNGEWKQNVGGDLTSVSKNVQEQADKAYSDLQKYKDNLEIKDESDLNAKENVTDSKKDRPAVRVSGQDYYVDLKDKNIGKYTSVKTGAELPIQSEKYKALEDIRNKKPGEDKTDDEAIQEEPEKNTPISKKDDAIEDDEKDDVKEDPSSIQKLSDDLEVMKKMTERDKVEKKFKGMVERAYKMRNEDKISRSTYTEYKKKAAQVLGGKYNLDKEEAKIKAEQFFEDIKKKLLGDGAKMNKAFSAPGITPKVVSDLIDLASKATVIAIDKGGYDLAQAVKRAVAYIKVKNPRYKKLVDAGVIDEDTFEKEVEAKIKEEQEPEKPVEKEESSVSDKNTEDKKEVVEVKKSESAPEKTESEKDSFTDGEKKKKKSIARIEDDPEFKKLRSNVSDDDVMYSVTKKKMVADYVNKKLDEFSKNGTLLDVATDMANDKTVFPDLVHGVAYGFMAKRIAELSEREGVNPAEADMLMSIAGKLYTKFTDFGYNAGVQASLQDVVNKELGTVSSSEALTREAVHQKVKKIQEESLTPKEKSQIKEVNDDIQKEWSANLQEAVNDKIAEISKSVLGEEKSKTASEFFASLKNDLKDC